MDRCENCMAWEKLVDRDDGLCKRQSPRMVDKHMRGRFPIVYSCGWCMEHVREKEGKETKGAEK